MSKLADAIRRSQRIEAAPMGFGAARPAQKATMLVGYVTTDVSAVAGAVAAGADLVLLDARARAVAAADVEKLRADAGSAALGVWGSVVAADIKGLQQAGLDFLAFDPETTPAAVLLDEDLGYVLMLPSEPDELYLRSLEPLQLDALLQMALPTTFTVARQIELTRTAALAHKPLVSQVQPDIANDELQCLRAAGIIVLLVSGDAAGIGQLKTSVMALPAKRQRRDDRAVVTLPRSRAAEPEEDDDDDEP